VVAGLRCCQQAAGADDNGWCGSHSIFLRKVLNTLRSLASHSTCATSRCTIDKKLNARHAPLLLTVNVLTMLLLLLLLLV
jgi:hypothetical protein